MGKWVNYHSHTFFCDGSSHPEEYVKEAINQELMAYGFSSHAPVPFPTDWCIPDNKLHEYIHTINNLKDHYSKHIQIYLGLEIDYVPGIMPHLNRLLSDIKIDFCIHSIHFVDNFSDGTPWNIDTSPESFENGLDKIFNGNIRRAATRFWELTRQMILEEKPQIIGHLDKIKMFNTNKRYFSEDEQWYVLQVDQTLEEIKKAGSIVEINTRGYYRYGQPDLYPGEAICKKLSALNIPVMINSDSHDPADITKGLPYAAKKLNHLGMNEVMVLHDSNWVSCKVSENGIALPL